MNIDNLTCAVCGTPLNDTQGPCPVCGFAFSGVSGFSGEKSRQFWNHTVSSLKKQREQQHRELLLTRLRRYRFELFPSCLCMFDPDSVTMTMYSGSRPPEKFQNVVQCSVSTRHTVFLKDDGTVFARGSNDDGQCDLADLTEVVSVYAGSTCTYAVLADGTVAVRGYTQHERTISTWTDIRKIVGSKGRIVGLTKDGKLEIADDLRTVRPDVTDAADVSTTYNYTIWRKTDGTVGCLANPNDARSAVDGWTDVISAGADNYSAVGLRSDGRIVCSAAAAAAFDLGRSRIPRWENAAAIACSPSCILAVFEDGSAEIAGSAEKREALCAALTEDLRTLLMT